MTHNGKQTEAIAVREETKKKKMQRKMKTATKPNQAKINERNKSLDVGFYRVLFKVKHADQPKNLT